MRRSILLALLLALPGVAHARDFRFAKASGAQVDAAFARFESQPAGWKRTRAASEAFLGAPYVLSPLGEGQGPDVDPRARWDAVDCVTFVETALAVGNSRNRRDAEALLDDIRYDGAPRFENRLHLMVAQWIPAQIRKGYLEDVTARFGETVEAAVEYSEASWKKRTSLRSIPWSEKLAGRHAIPVIPIEDAVKLGPTLPEGLVINVVREEKPGRPYIVSHTGFVVIQDGKRFVRHARPNWALVVDEPIERFLRRHAQMRKWKVRGIHLLAVRDNSARADALAAARRVVAAP